MPSRGSVPLPGEAKDVLAARLTHARDAAARALEDFHADVHLANAMGMTIAEIAAALGERPSTVGDWSLRGRAVVKRRKDA